MIDVGRDALMLLDNWQALAKRAGQDDVLLARLDAWCRIGNWIRTGRW